MLSILHKQNVVVNNFDKKKLGEIRNNIFKRLLFLKVYYNHSNWLKAIYGCIK